MPRQRERWAVAYFQFQSQAAGQLAALVQLCNHRHRASSVPAAAHWSHGDQAGYESLLGLSVKRVRLLPGDDPQSIPARGSGLYHASGGPTKAAENIAP